MKVVLAGSVIFSRRMLDLLLQSAPRAIHVAAVFAIPPERSAPISDYADLRPVARDAGVPCYAFDSINSPDVIERFQSIRPDCTFIFGLSQLLKADLLARAGLVIGTHPTLLPDGRGRAAIPWSILLGWPRSGISFFGITEGVDDGLIYQQEPWDIAPDDDSETLYGEMCDAGERAFRRLLADLAAGTLVGRPQGRPRVGPLQRRRPEDGRIDWNRPAMDLDRLIRASTRPYPGAFCDAPDGLPARRLILWKSGGVARERSGPPGTVLAADRSGVVVAAGDCAVRVREVELAGAGVTITAPGDFAGAFHEGRRICDA